MMSCGQNGNGSSMRTPAADLRAKEELLANKQIDLQEGALSRQVAAAAIADREQKVAVAEADLKTRIAAHEAAFASLNRRVANMRSALG